MSLSIRHPKAPARGSAGFASHGLRSTLVSLGPLGLIVVLCASCELVIGNIPDKSGAAGATPYGTSGPAGGQGGAGSDGTGGVPITDANGERGCDADGDGFLSVGCNGGDERYDCDDANYYAHPDQTKFFPVARQNGSFDYNCNGSIEQEPTLDCAMLGGLLCATTVQGFLKPWPACGQSGTWGYCEMGVPCAEHVLETRVMGCH